MSKEITKVTEEEIDLYLPEDLKEKQFKANKKADKSMKKMLAYIIKWSYTIEAQYNGYCYIPDDTMHDAVGMDKSNICCYAQTLINLGYLESFQRGNKRDKDQPSQATRYKLIDSLTPKVEIVKDCTENVQSYSEKVQSYSEKVQSYSPNSSVLLQENISLIDEKKTENISLIEEKDCNIIKDNISKSNITKQMTDYNKLIDSINSLQLTVGTLQSTVEELKEKNEELKGQMKMINDFVKKHCINPESPIYSKFHPTKTTSTVEVKKAAATVQQSANGNTCFDTIKDLGNKIHDRSMSFNGKLEIAKQLEELVQSGNLTDGQVKMCNQWIEPYSEHLKAAQSASAKEETISTKIAELKDNYHYILNAWRSKQYDKIDENGQSLLNQVDEMRQLIKANQVSKQANDCKLQAICAIGNADIREIKDYLANKNAPKTTQNCPTIVSNCQTDTSDHQVKESPLEAKKAMIAKELERQNRVKSRILELNNEYINNLGSMGKFPTNGLRKLYFDELKNVEEYSPSNSTDIGIASNCFDSFLNTVNEHNSAISKNCPTIASNCQGGTSDHQEGESPLEAKEMPKIDNSASVSYIEVSNSQSMFSEKTLRDRERIFG